MNWAGESGVGEGASGVVRSGRRNGKEPVREAWLVEGRRRVGIPARQR